MVTKLQTFLVY